VDSTGTSSLYKFLGGVRYLGFKTHWVRVQLIVLFMLCIWRLINDWTFNSIRVIMLASLARESYFRYLEFDSKLFNVDCVNGMKLSFF